MNISHNLTSIRPERSVSADILGAVKKELGENVLSGMDDGKVDILKRFFLDGEEFRDYDAIKQLGRGWVEKSEDVLTHEYELTAGPNHDSQRLTVDARKGDISLTTINQEPGPFEGHIQSETIIWHVAGDLVERSRFGAL